MRTAETRGYDHDDGATTASRKEQFQSQKRSRTVMCAAGSGTLLHADIPGAYSGQFRIVWSKEMTERK